MLKPFLFHSQMLQLIHYSLSMMCFWKVLTLLQLSTNHHFHISTSMLNIFPSHDTFVVEQLYPLCLLDFRCYFSISSKTSDDERIKKVPFPIPCINFTVILLFLNMNRPIFDIPHQPSTLASSLPS